MTSRSTLVVILATLAACGGGQRGEEAQPAPAAEPAIVAPPIVLEGDFATPESALYDADQDVYFVSNINGGPLDADGNGFISRIDAGTQAVTWRWVDGSNDGFTLNAPKGMALTGDVLWVTDIDVVRRFDRRSGAPLGEIAIAGSTFLNDLAVAAGGGVYVSDSGMRAGAEGLEPSGTASIWRIAADDTVERLIDGAELMAPNGLAEVDGQLWAVGFGGDELYRVADGARHDAVALPAGSLDGLVVFTDGDALVSSWDASAVFRGPLAGPFEVVVADVVSPADIGYDAGRKLVLVPLFGEDRVVLAPLR